ncbi:hypothetical protein K488DRAFT_41272, partial [Vararia minispora EC-137]
DNAHWSSSSNQNSTCTVRPASAEDVATILRMLAPTSIPFAVKGGGHAMNVGFSSTEGVQVAMSAISDIVLNTSTSTVEVGAGCIWDDVYAALDGTGYNVVGGRIAGVGVAGFSLGGDRVTGYSYKSSQYGLTVDNIVAYELVLPNGTITTVTEEDEDLFFGLRGGFNNFGIVTKFTYKAHPQTEIWGGYLTITENYLDSVVEAIAKFSEKVTDTKAAFLPSYGSVNGTISATLILFYDAPSPPDGIFDDVLAIPASFSDIKTRSYVDLLSSIPSGSNGPRGAFQHAQVAAISPAVLNAMKDMTSELSRPLWHDHGVTYLYFFVEPFTASLFKYGSDSAWPPDRSRLLLPINVDLSWESEDEDEYIFGLIKTLAANLTATADAEGQNVAGAPVYPNYMLGDTPVERIYSDNLLRLREIRAAVDPEGVMSLAGGFKF